MEKGLFVVLDGNDGSGKATQAKLLAEHLQQQSGTAVKMDFPGYTRSFFGNFVGECLAGKHGDFLHMDPKLASLPYAVDRFEASESIREILASGGVVVADRFSSSNQIHQGGKIADVTERTAFLTWLDRAEHEILKIPRPDLIVYLRVPVEISLKLLQEKRGKNAHLGEQATDTVEEDRAYLEHSYETANWLATQQANWVVVECTRDGKMRPIEDIHLEIREIVARARGR